MELSMPIFDGNSVPQAAVRPRHTPLPADAWNASLQTTRSDKVMFAARDALRHE